MTQNPIGNNFWAKQSYLFVHFCLLGKTSATSKRWRHSFRGWPASPWARRSSRNASRRTWGMSKQLWGYIPHTKHKYQRCALKPEDRLTPKSIELREATVAEAAAFDHWRRAAALSGRHDLALATYRSAYPCGSCEPAISGGMGTEAAPGHAPIAPANSWNWPPRPA